MRITGFGDVLPASPTGVQAGGDLGGTLPGPIVTGIGGYPISGTLTAHDLLQFDGTQWVLVQPTSFSHEATIGDGVSLSYAVAHGLGSTDVHVTVFRVSDGVSVLCDVARTDANTVTVAFSRAPATWSLRVLITTG